MTSTLQRLALLAGLTLTLAACGASNSPTSPSGTTTAGLGGTWKGTLTQPNGPAADIFEFTLTLTQSGNALTGRSRIEETTGTPRYFAEFSVTGSITGDRMDVVEGAVLSELPRPGLGWCIKTHALTADAARRTLTGSWTAPGCLPGQVRLSR